MIESDGVSENFLLLSFDVINSDVSKSTSEVKSKSSKSCIVFSSIF